MTALQSGLTLQYKVHFTQARHGRRRMAVGDAPLPIPVPLGHVPRISRLVALAIRFERLVASGEVRDFAELARLGHVSRARVTQIMNLLNLAPDLQENLLFLPPTKRGRDPIRELAIRPIAAEPNWLKQRQLWKGLADKNQSVAETA